MGMMVGLAGPAAAANPGVDFTGVSDSSGNEVEGIYTFKIGSKTVRFMCTDTGHAPPNPANVDYHLSEVNGAYELAYLLGRYGDTTSKNRAAALNYIARNSAELHHSHKSGHDPKNSKNISNMSSAMAMVDTMMADAAKHAGPYKLSTKITKNANGTYNVATDLKSKAGNRQAGFTVDLSITTENGVFTSNNKPTRSITTSSSGVVNATVTATAADLIEVKATAKDVVTGKVEMILPGSSTTKSSSGSAGHQRGLSTDSFRASITATDQIDHPRFQVGATTKSSPQSASADGKPTDITDSQTIRVTDGAWQPGASVEVISTLWGPMSSKPSEQANPPSGTPVAGTVTYTATKAGTYTTPKVTVNSPGYYTWTVTIPKGDFNEQYRSRFAETDETTLVTWNPKVATQVQSPIVEAGASLADDITLTGGRPGETYVVSSTLWGPMTDKPAVGKPVPAGTAKLATVSTSLKANSSGKATGTSPATKLPAPGFYVYTESIPASGTSQAWTGNVVLASETALQKWEPKVATTVQSPVVTAGTAMTDNITVTEGRPGETYEVVSSLWGPMTSRPAVGEPVPDGVDLVDTVTTSITVGTDGTGSAQSPETVLDEPGFYVYTETIPESDTSTAWTGEMVLAEETAISRWQPRITTQASSDVVAAGDTVHDTLVADGFPPDYEIPVNVGLYYSQDEWAADVDVDELEPIAEWTVTVSGDGDYVTDDFEVPTTPGLFTFYATVDQSDLVEDFAPVFPEPEETFLLPYELDVTTVAQLADTSEAGATVTDLVEVTGGLPGSTVEVVSTLWGPFLDTPPLIERADGNQGGIGEECSPAVVPGEAGAGAAGVVTTLVDLDETGAGTAVTEPIQVTERGFYVWTETVAGSDLSRCWSSDFGVTEETVLLQWQPAIATVASQESAEIGASVFDQVTISGLPANHGALPAVWEVAEDGPTSTPAEAWRQPGTADAIAALGAHPTDADTVTVTLWGPLTVRPEAGQPVPDGAAKVGSVQLAAVNGTQSTDPIGPLTAPGWYVFTVEWPDSLRVEGGITPAETSEMVWVAEPISVQGATTGGGLASTGTPPWVLPAGLLALLAICGGAAMIYGSDLARRRVTLRTW